MHKFYQNLPYLKTNKTFRELQHEIYVHVNVQMAFQIILQYNYTSLTKLSFTKRKKKKRFPGVKIHFFRHLTFFS